MSPPIEWSITSDPNGEGFRQTKLTSKNSAYSL